MKKVYEAPDMELVRFLLPDAILDSGLEQQIGENIGGEEGGDDELIPGGLN